MRIVKGVNRAARKRVRNRCGQDLVCKGGRTSETYRTWIVVRFVVAVGYQCWLSLSVTLNAKQRRAGPDPSVTSLSQRATRARLGLSNWMQCSRFKFPRAVSRRSFAAASSTIIACPLTLWIWIDGAQPSCQHGVQGEAPRGGECRDHRLNVTPFYFISSAAAWRFRPRLRRWRNSAAHPRKHHISKGFRQTKQTIVLSTAKTKRLVVCSRLWALNREGVTLSLTLILSSFHRLPLNRLFASRITRRADFCEIRSVSFQLSRAQ